MKIPDSWADVTISQYYDLLDVMDLPLNDEEKALTMLSSLTGQTVEYLQDDISIAQLIKGINSIKFIGEDVPLGVAKPSFKCGGKNFSFDMILKGSNASSFISLSELVKDPVKAKKNIHNLIAVFCYETNMFGFRKTRTVNSQKEIAEHLKKYMNMDDAFKYRDFFLRSYKTLSKATLTYLDKQNKKILKELQKVQRS